MYYYATGREGFFKRRGKTLAMWENYTLAYEK